MEAVAVEEVEEVVEVVEEVEEEEVERQLQEEATLTPSC